MIKKLAKNVLIPVVLFLFWIGMGIILNPYASFSIITVPHSHNDLTHWNYDELLKNNYIAGSFTASQNNLGIIAFRFNTYHRINGDVVLFKIKPKGAKEWYYQNTYKVDQFQPDGLFTFGFPIIKISKGHRYDFEIISTKGIKDNAVAVSSVEPVFATKYQFPKSLIIHNVHYGIQFLFLKIYYSLIDRNFYSFSFIFLIPFTLFILHQLLPLPIKFQRNTFYVFLLLTTILVLIVSDEFRIWITFGTAIIWFILLVTYKQKFYTSFLFAAIMLTVTPLSMVLGQEIIAERAAMSAYFFLLLGFLGLIYEQISLLALKKLKK